MTAYDHHRRMLPLVRIRQTEIVPLPVREQRLRILQHLVRRTDPLQRVQHLPPVPRLHLEKRQYPPAVPAQVNIGSSHFLSAIAVNSRTALRRIQRGNRFGFSAILASIPRATSGVISCLTSSGIPRPNSPLIFGNIIFLSLSINKGSPGNRSRPDRLRIRRTSPRKAAPPCRWCRHSSG